MLRWEKNLGTARACQHHCWVQQAESLVFSVGRKTKSNSRVLWLPGKDCKVGKQERCMGGDHGSSSTAPQMPGTTSELQQWSRWLCSAGAVALQPLGVPARQITVFVSLGLYVLCANNSHWYNERNPVLRACILSVTEFRTSNFLVPTDSLLIQLTGQWT